AVNTVEVCSNRLIGHNTDGRGFLASLTEMDIDPSGQRVILVGAGGAAKGVSIALLSAGVSELIIMARRSDHGKRLADRLAALFSHVDISVSGMHPEERVFQQKDRPTLLINTTPLGMKGDDPIPFTPSLIESEWIVADLVYRPAETPLLSAARNIGAKRVPGHGMLLHQGALAFEIWTNEKAPLAVMKNALWNALSSQGSS
ncbi:MAG: shikimate dehydrogenase family protein, partial [Nitrospiria bacterium]